MFKKYFLIRNIILHQLNFTSCLLDGLEAAMKIKERNNTTPIVALTAHALAETRQEALRSGMKGVITNPCTFEQLQSACEMYIMNKKHEQSR